MMDETIIENQEESATDVVDAAVLANANEAEETSSSTDTKSSLQESAVLDTPPTKPKSTKGRARYYIPVKVGQQLSGKIKTVTDFGAFVDLGLAVDGLVHISSMSRRRVDKVTDLVSVGDEVTVWVKSVDTDRGRIGLTMIKPIERKYSDLSEGDILVGEVKRIESYGVFVDVGLEREGLVHVSELSHEFIQTPADVVKIGSRVDVKVLNIDSRKKQVNLSIKALLPVPEQEVEEVVEEEEEEELILEEEPMQTTMAAAFGIVETDQKPVRKRKAKKRKKNKRAMDDVIARTLQANQGD